MSLIILRYIKLAKDMFGIESTGYEAIINLPNQFLMVRRLVFRNADSCYSSREYAGHSPCRFSFRPAAVRAGQLLACRSVGSYCSWQVYVGRIQYTISVVAALVVVAVLRMLVAFVPFLLMNLSGHRISCRQSKVVFLE